PFGQTIFLYALLEKNKEDGPNNIMTAFLDDDLIMGRLIKHIENKALLPTIREAIVLPILNGLNKSQKFHSEAYAIPLLYIFYLEHQIEKAPALEIEKNEVLAFKK